MNKNIEERKFIDGGDYGIYFPWFTLVLLFIGILSEVTDGFMLVDILSRTLSGLSTERIYVISFITAGICFFSMAAIGYTSANKKIKYSTKFIEIACWAIIGVYLVWLRINEPFFEYLLQGEVGEFFRNKDVVMGVLEVFLYFSSGLMTYSSSKQLSKPELYEYVLAKREYNKLVNEALDLKEELLEGITSLNNYQSYAKRLVNSKDGIVDQIEAYNKQMKAIYDAKIALMTEPDIMDDMYKLSMEKETKEKKHEIVMAKL